MSQEELKDVLEGFLDTDLDFNFKDCWNQDLDFRRACQGESLLLEDKKSGGALDMSEFSWSPSVFPPPFGEVSASHGSGAAPVDGASRTSDHPSLDTASSSGERWSAKKMILPSPDFTFGRGSGIPSFGMASVCRHETITTGVPGTLQDWYNSGRADNFLPMGMCPAVQNVPLEKWKTHGSEHGSTDKPAEVPKRQRVEDPDWSLIKDPEERKRQKRMAKNRHTAAVSRERRRKYLNDLENRVKTLEHENMSLRYWLGAAQHENLALKAGTHWCSSVQNPAAGAPGMVWAVGRDNQEPAVLYKFTLLAILQMVVSPAILPFVGLLVVLMGSVHNSSDEDLSGFTASSFVCVAILVLGLLCASTLQEKHKDRKRKWGEIDVNNAFEACVGAKSQNPGGCLWHNATEVKPDDVGNLFSHQAPNDM